MGPGLSPHGDKACALLSSPWTRHLTRCNCVQEARCSWTREKRTKKTFLSEKLVLWLNKHLEKHHFHAFELCPCRFLYYNCLLYSLTKQTHWASLLPFPTTIKTVLSSRNNTPKQSLHCDYRYDDDVDVYHLQHLSTYNHSHKQKTCCRG